MRKQILGTVLFLLTGLACLGLFVLNPKPASAANPATMNFQGKVVNADGTNVTNGTYSFIFRIYNTASPTTTTSCTTTASCLWEETQSSVTITNGVFQVELGSACSLTGASCNNSAGGPINWSSNSSLYLTMKFNGDAAGFMSPLVHLTSVPFAFQADNASNLGGLAAGNFVQLAQGVQNDSSTTNASIAINKTGGTAGILDLQKSGVDVATISNTGQVAFKPYTASDSTTEFQVQRADTTQVFTVDTANSITNVQGINSTATFSSELLNQPPPNNNFNNATYWTLGTGWGGATATQVTATNATGTLDTTSSDLTVTAGTTYQVIFTISGYSGSDCIAPEIGGRTGGGVCGDSTNETQLINVVNTTQLKFFSYSNNFSGIISNVSVKALAQATNPVIAVNNSDGTTGVEIRAGGSNFRNTYIGLNSGVANTTGLENTALGYSALSFNTTGEYNSATGAYALYSNTTGLGNNAYGDSALYLNTSGNYNNAFGGNTLLSNTTGNNNIAVGDSALASNTSGSHNVGVGTLALNSNSSGSYNNAFGDSALFSNITGSYNTALGLALYNNTTGFENIGIGDSAIGGNQTGNYNIGLGLNALNSGNLGDNNIGIGSNAGYSLGPSDTNNTFIGGNAGSAAVNIQNATAVGYNSQVQESNALVLGGQGVSATNVGIGTSSPSSLFSISPDIYDTGRAYQDNGSAGVAGTIIHSSFGATWTANMVGMEFIFNTSEKETITGFTNATTLTGSVSQLIGSVGSESFYSIHNPAFFVSSTGQTQVRTSTNSTAGFQVQNASGTDVLTVDTTNTQLKLRASDPLTLGSELFTSITNCSGANWTVAGGSATHATGNYDTLDCTVPTVTAGTTYQISYTVAGNSNPSDPNAGIFPSIGGTYDSAINYTQNGIHTTLITAGGTNDLGFDGDVDFDGSISSISVKAVTATIDNPIIAIANADNTPALQVRTGVGYLQNLFVGNSSGQSNTIGSSNLGIGNYSLESNTIGSNNLAFGDNSLQSNTTGGANIAIGFQALQSNTTGGSNLAFGGAALKNNTSGTFNTGIGSDALYANTTGFNNIALGGDSLFNNTTGNANTAIGIGALSSNTTGSTNTAVGGNLNHNTTGSFNSALGGGALQQNTTGTDNNAFGYTALLQNTTGSNNNAVGNSALYSNTFGVYNIAVGDSALYSNTTGSLNNANGSYALYSNTTGGTNVATGSYALQSNTTGANNTATGDFALNNNLNGYNNTADGYNSLNSNTSGALNSAFGDSSLGFNDTGNNNTAIGWGSLLSNVTGSNNTAIGYFAGYQDPTVAAFATLSNLQNATAVGYGSQVQESNALVLGGQGLNAVNVGIGTTSPTNTFSVSPDVYDTGTASTTASATVVGSGTTWTANMVGMEFIFANGNKYTITGFTDTTHLTLSASSTNASQVYRIHNPAFFVSSTGQTQVRTSTNSTSAFQVQSAAGTQVLGVDTTNSITNVQGINSVATLGSELATSPTCSGTNWSGSGAGPYTHTPGSTTALVCSPPATLTTNSYYQVVFSTSSVTAGYVRAVADSAFGPSISTDITGETEALGPTSGSTGVEFDPHSAFNGAVTITSVKQITTANPVLSISNSDGSSGVEIRSGGSGLQNTFIGIGSGTTDTTGQLNVGLGNYTLDSNTTGSLNTAIGSFALQFNTIGTNNTAVGQAALNSNTIGVNNNAFGENALVFNINGSSNNAVGSDALLGNISGNFNNAVGDSALFSNTTGYSNNALGGSALYSNTTGTNNVGIGDAALNNNVTGTWNTAVGTNSLFENINGGSNTAFGDDALLSNTSGYVNVAVGEDAGAKNLSGAFNTFLGAEAGDSDPNAGAFATLGNLQYATAVGYGSQVQESNAIVLGAVGRTSSNLTPNVGIGTTSPTNTFSVSPDIYDTGNASVTSGTTAVSESGATWSSNYAGMEIIFADGTKYTISSATSTTITLSSNATATETASAYRIHNPAFFVSSTGQTGVRTSTNSTTAFQVQNSAGTDVLTADTVNSKVVLRAADPLTLGSELFTNITNCSGPNWTVAGGSATHATGNYDTLDCTVPTVTASTTYQISFTITGNSNPSDLYARVYPSIGNAYNGATGYSSNGDHNIIITASSTSDLGFDGDINFDGSISNISVKQVTGIADKPALTIENSNNTGALEVRTGGWDTGNLFIGEASGQANTVGMANLGIGQGTLQSNTTGVLNAGVGLNALYSNTTGSENSAFGAFALQSNVAASGNNAFGDYSLASNTVGGENSAFGDRSLSTNVSGSQNSAFGYGTLQFSSAGIGNNAFGALSLHVNIDGTTNNAFGSAALANNHHGSDNSAFGSSALLSSEGSGNTAFGNLALASVISGNYNTAIGDYAGYEDPNATTFHTSTNLQNATAVGYGSQVQESNAIVLGAVGTTSSNLTPNVGIGTTSPTNTFSVSPDVYDTGTASVTSGTTAVTESGATWSSNYAGMEIIFADGTKYAIASATSSTITLSSNATVTETASAYRIHNPAFFVSSTGQTQVRTSTNSTAGFQVQSAAGTQVLSVDTTNSITNVQGINSVATFSSELLNQPPPNNNFNNATYWALGTGWGSATATQVTATNATGTLDTTSSDLTVTAGVTYQVVFTVSSYSGTGCLTPNIGIISGQLVCGDSSGETQFITAFNTTQLTFISSGSFSGIVSDVSVTQLSQTTNPVLSINNSDGTAGVEIRSGGSSLFNVFIGLSSGQNDTVNGENNTAVGDFSLASNVSGSSNTALGYDSLLSNTTGSDNNAIGAGSLLLNTTGVGNNALGMQTLNSNTTGSYNNAVGESALASNTTGNFNNAFGNSALNSNTIGTYNSAFGSDSLQNNTGNSNSAFGGLSLVNNTTGGGNNAFGGSSLFNNTTGTNNAAFGLVTLQGNTSGFNNSAFGGSSLQLNTTGIYNSSLGYNSGNANTTGNDNTILGADAGSYDPNISSFVTLANLQNATAVGYGSQIQESNALILGGQGANAVKVGIGTTSPTNTFSVSPDIYDTGTASVTSGTAAVTESGATWSSNYAGMEIIFADGTKYTISSATSTTITLSSNATVTETASAYRIHNPAFFVSSTGQTQVRTSTNSTTGFQVQSAAGTQVLGVDTTNSITDVQGINSVATLGSELATSPTCSGTNWSGSGAGPYTHTAGSTVALSCTPPASVTAGAYYLLVFTTAGTVSVTPNLGGSNGQTISTASTNQTQIMHASNTNSLIFTPSSATTGSVTMVSLKLVTTSTSVMDVNNSNGSVGVEIRSGGSAKLNTFIGLASGLTNTTGGSNTAVGVDALNWNTSGSDNTAIGLNSLGSNTTGSFSTAIGYNSLGSNTTGQQNSALGLNSLDNNTTGSFNTAFGNAALQNNTTGSNNTAIGYSAGYQDPTVNSFVSLGGLQNTTTIGYGAEVQSSSSLILGGQGANAVNVGIGTTSPGHNFSISPDIYDTGTASTTASATVVGSGTTWTANMVGDDFIFANGNKFTINSFTDATHLTLNSSSTNASQAYRIHNPAFYVTSQGTSALRSSTNSNTAFLLQDAAGNSYLSGDSSNDRLILGQSSATNGTIVFNSSAAGANNVTLSLQANPTSSYSLFLPTTGPAVSQCLQTDGSIASQLVFASCGSGSGDNGFVNGSALTDFNIQDVTGSGTITGTTWSTSGVSPTIVTLGIANASASVAGAVTNGTQTLAGDKTLTGATAFAPTGNNVGTTVKQTSGTATSGSVFDVQAINGTSHFIQVTQTAANAGAVAIASLGSNDLTLDSGSGNLILGSNTTTLQKSATAFTLDVTNASDSTLTITNSGAGVASLSVEGDIAAGSGRVFKVGATSGTTISTCGANNYVGSFQSTGGLVTGGSCGTIASTNLSDTANIARLNAANTFAPTGNNVGTVIKQTSGTATSGNIFDVQGANGTTHFIQVIESAANAAAVSIASVGSNDLTLDSGSGTIKLGSNTTTIQKNASAFTVDLNNAGTSTLNVSNSNGANVANLSVTGSITSGSDIVAGSGHVFKVGATSGSTISTCGANNYVGSFQSTGGLVTGGTCTALPSGGDNGFVNSVAVTDFNLQDVAASTSVTGTTWTASGSGPTNVTLAISNASATTIGSVTTSAQTFAGVKTFQDFVILQPAASMTAGQTALTQTLTNASSTGGTVQGYSQTISVAPTSSASTTNGFNIAITDATTLANTTNGAKINITDNGASGAKNNTGLSIALQGSNTSQIQYGIDASVTKGIGVRASTSGAAGNSISCGSNSGNLAIALCAVDSSGSGLGSGIVGQSNSTSADANSASIGTGVGVFGFNNNTITSSTTIIGTKGSAISSGSSGSYKAIGVNGIAKAASSSATAYGGYFALDSGSSATLGSALYASNSTVAANILQLQNNTTDVMTVANGGHIYVNSTYAAMSAPGTVTAAIQTGGSLTASQAYFYKVTAIDSVGGETTASPEVTCTTGVTTCPATGSTPANKTIALSWTAISGASGYKIYRSTTTGTEVYYTSVIANSFTDSGQFTAGSGSAPGSNTAVVSTNNTNVLNQISVGGNGTPTGQVYVGGIVPSGPLSTVFNDFGNDAPVSVYVQGRYAYVSEDVDTTIVVYDISNPAAPFRVSKVSVASASIDGLYVQGNYLYIEANAGSPVRASLLIYNISNPASLSLVGSVLLGAIGGDASVYVQGRYAYVQIDNDKLYIIDAANPASPVTVGSISTGANSNFQNVYVQGKYAYLVAGNNLLVINISNPSSPSQTASLAGFANAASIYVQGRYAYIANTGANNLKIVDISNPSSPSILSTLSSVNTSQGIFVQNRYAYVTNGTSNTLQTIDVSNPASPVSVGTTSTGASTSPLGIFVAGRYAYVTDDSNTVSGMQVFDLGGTYTQQLEAGGAELGTLSVDSNANFAGDASIAGGVNVGSLQAAGNVATAGNLYVQGATQFAGGILGGTTISNLSTPGAPTVASVGANANTVTWTYRIAAVSASGGITAAGSAGSVSATDNATLTTSNFNRITWSAVSGATSYKVYRTAVGTSPATTGLIATVSATILNDTGLAGDSSNFPTTDSSANFTVDGLVTLQPAVSLIANQNGLTQTLTNADTTGGTVNGYSQTISVAPTSSASTTNGFNISLTDNTALGNTNTGIKISLAGSNANQIQYGISASANHGVGIYGSSSGSAGISNICGTSGGAESIGVCGISTNNANDVGVAGSTNTGGNLNTVYGTGVRGLNYASGSVGNGYAGVKALSLQSAAAAYTSAGIYSAAKGGVGATVYGGYFDLLNSSATAGSALFATNGSAAANILELQDATTSATDVLTVADGGALTITPKGDNIGTIVRQTTGTATSGNVLDVQTANGTSHFIQITNAAANEGAVTVQSIGATRDLTLDSGSGTIKLGGNSTVLQKSASAFTLDLTNAGTSTLTLSNSNGANVANLSVSGDIAAGSGHVFKVGATSGSTISTCGANNYVGSFQSTGGLVTGGSCGTIASSNLSDSSNIALLNAANTFAPTGNNIGNIFKQTSGTATSGNVFDVQAVNGTSHFIQVTQTAANAGAVNISSIGSNDLTLDSGSAVLKFGTNTTSIQKAASSFTLDVNNAGTSTLNVSNSNGANVANLSVSGSITAGTDVVAGSGHVFKVGATSGSTISTCGANNYVSSFASTGGLVTGGSCTALTTYDNVTVNGSAATDANFTDVAAASAVTGTTWSLNTGTTPNNITIAIANATNTTAGSITAGTQTIGGDKTLSGNTSLTGTVVAQNSANSANAFVINNQSGSQILGVDTTVTNNTNVVANPSFESAISNWSAVGTGTAAQSSAQTYEGNDSLLITSGATEGGASYSTSTSMLAVSTTYTMSAYIKTDSNTPIHIDMGEEDVSPTLLPCLTNQLLPQNGGWQRFTCTFTTGATVSNSLVYIKQTSTDPAGTKNIYVDDILVQTDANANTNYRNGAIDLTGAIINGAVVLQNATNSTNALQVENSSGNTIFNVDTTDSNLISNPGFETNATGWSALASTTTRRDSSKSYLGNYSYQVAIAGSTTGGAQFTLNPVVTALSTQYTISFFAILGSGTAPTFQATYDPTGANPGTCSPTGTIVTGGWMRLSCTLAADGTHTPTTGGLIKIAQTNSNASTWYIDGIQLEAATAASAYGAGSITLNGVISSPVIFKSAAATTAFQIQNSSNLTLFSADSLNNLIQIGSSVSHASNPVVLVLDDYNNASDPTSAQATNGAMYYNASSNKFRCFQNGTWTNCIGVVNAVTLVAVRTGSTGAIANSETQVLGYTIPLNSTAAGDTYRITAYYTRAGTNATAPTFRIRVGSTTLTGNIAATLTGSAAGTANNGVVEGIVTVQTTGSGGTVGGGMWNLHNADTSPHVASTAVVAVDTTANKIVELTCISGQTSNSYTFTYVTIEKISNQ